MRRTAALVLLLALPSGLRAQVVEVQLREEGTRAAVAGAIVRLLRDGRAVTQGLSNEGGRVTLRPPQPGSYRLKVDRIGWTGLLTQPFEVAAGEIVRREVVMSSTRVDLPAIEVRGKSACGRQEQGGALATALWDEIQKALTASVITQRQGEQPLHVREFLREVDRSGRRLREWNILSTLRRGQVYASLPPGQLARAGFVIEERHDSVTYAAPDAALLLSEEFVSTHCFQAVPGEGTLVGLGFEPIPGRKLPDVSGTLWVDRATSELKHIDFRYTGLPGILAKAELGGRVEFEQFHSGAWIPAYWHVRTPWLEESEMRGTGNVRHQVARLVGYLDRGGRVAPAADSTGIVNRAIVTGRVVDSTRDAGLAGAVVKVEGSADSVLTDDAGRFDLAVPLAGDQRLVVRHPKLAVLGVATPWPVLLSVGDTLRVEFGVPSMARIVRSYCGNPKGRAGVIGMVLDANGRPVAGVEVSTSWRPPAGGLKMARDRTTKDGVFALCDLPADTPLPFAASEGSRPPVGERVELDWEAYRWLDIRLPPE